MYLASSCSYLCPIKWSQVLSREWRCNWSSADRRCSNYIWVIDNSIAYQGASYIRDLTVCSVSVAVVLYHVILDHDITTPGVSITHTERLLTHWGRVTHLCVSKLSTLGSDNGLSPGRRQAIIWTNGGILLIWPLGTNFSEILIEINTFSFKKMYLKVSSGKWRPFVSASMS